MIFKRVGPYGPTRRSYAAKSLNQTERQPTDQAKEEKVTMRFTRRYFAQICFSALALAVWAAALALSVGAEQVYERFFISVAYVAVYVVLLVAAQIKNYTPFINGLRVWLVLGATVMFFAAVATMANANMPIVVSLVTAMFLLPMGGLFYFGVGSAVSAVFLAAASIFLCFMPQIAERVRKRRKIAKKLK